MTRPSPDEERRYKPDRRSLDEDTMQFRTSVTGTLEEVATRLDKGDERFQSVEGHIDRLEQKIDANTEATKKNAEDTSELLDIVKSAKGAVKVLNWVGSAARPLTFIIALLSALWIAWKNR